MELTGEQRISLLCFVDPNKSKEDHENALNLLVEDVRTGKLVLEIIVRNLGESLTSMDDLVRSRGVSLISEVLTRVPTLSLTPQNASTFAQFLAARLLDFPTVPNVISALFALIHNHALHYQTGGETNPDFIVRALFNELHIPSLRQPVRKQVYEILNKLLIQYPESMQAIGRDFVVGVIQAIDMEKDPRNLINSFQLVRSTVLHIPVFIEFAEELFEVISCYFPISFRSDASDPDLVPREELQTSLLDVISCSSGFSKFSIPFFLDKINEVSPTDKLEVFHALAFSIDRYHKETQHTINSHPIQQEFGAIWSIYRSELTSPQDSEFHQECLGTLASIVKSLSFDLVHTYEEDTSNKSILDQFLTPIVRDCVHQMAAPDMNLASRSALILATCARQSLHACRRILGTANPVAVQTFLASDDSTSLQTTRMVNWFTKAAVAVFTNDTSSKLDRILLQKLQPIKNKLLPDFIGIVKDQSCSSLRRAAAIDGIQSYASLPGLLENSEEISLISLLTEVLLEKPLPDVDRSAQRQSLDALVVLQERQAEIISQETIPRLFDQLKVSGEQANEEDWSDEEDEPEIPSYALKALISLAKPLKVHCLLVTALLDHVGSPEGEIDLSKEYVLKKLEELLKSSTTEVKEWNLQNVVSRCISIAVSLHDASISLLISSMIFGIVKRTDTEAQRSVIRDYLNLFYSTVPVSSQELIDTCNVSGILPITKEWTEQQVQILPVVAGFIIPSNAKNLQEIMQENDSDLFYRIMSVSLALYDKNYDTKTQSKVLGAIINKCATGDSKLLEIVRTQILCKFDNLESSEKSLRDVELLMLVSKAFCIRAHAIGWECVRKMCSLVNQSHPVSPYIVNGFKQILDCSEEQENGFIVRSLYKQRFYHESKKLLFDPSKAANELSSSALMALSNILSLLPDTLMKQELPSIFPAIHESLKSENAALILSSLQSIQCLIVSAPSTIISHVDSLVKLLVKLSKFPGSLRVREQSVLTLEQFCEFPFRVLFPVQKFVITELQQVLDDRKRIVRRAASRCRNEWIVLSDV